MGKLRVYCLKTLNKLPIYPLGNTPSAPSVIDTPIVSVEAFVKNIQQVQKDTRVALEQAAKDMKRFYDKHRGTTPNYSIGQKVLLDNSDLSINRPSRKLAERRSGPFEVLLGRPFFDVISCSHWGQRGCYPGSKLRVY